MFLRLPGGSRMQPLSHPTASLDSRESEAKRRELCPAHMVSSSRGLTLSSAEGPGQAGSGAGQARPACGAPGNACSCLLLAAELRPELGFCPLMSF